MSCQGKQSMLFRIAFGLLLLLSPAVAAQDLDAALSALVRISGTRDGAKVRGSGFVVGLERDKATIVTVSHVIEGLENIQVTFAVDLTESISAGGFARWEAENPKGPAVLQVRGTLPTGVTSLSFETTKRPRFGEALFLLGFPEMAQAPRTAQRVLSALDGTLLLIDQGIGEGFSGGPVLQNGKVVGVVTGTDDQTTYAVEAVVVRAALEGWGVRLGEQDSIPAQPTPTACVPGQTDTIDGIVYVRICPGAFTMGSADDDPRAYDGEKPEHQVTLSEEFWLGQTEVTNKQYRRLQPNHEGADELPVVNVIWTEAKTACERFGGRLPTEAEWEYAARAGSETSWSFGGDEKLLGSYGWYDQNAGDKPHPVATRKPNPWGLYDMHGNVWEWVADWYAPYTKTAGPEVVKFRVLRGGAFDFTPRFLRSADRGGLRPEVRRENVGFRRARDPR
jgi:hypothetical protein